MMCTEMDDRMSGIPECERGFRDAATRAVTLAHAEASVLQDPRVRGVLISAALSIGVTLASRNCRMAARERARLDSDMICTSEPVPIPTD